MHHWLLTQTKKLEIKIQETNLYNFVYKLYSYINALTYQIMTIIWLKKMKNKNSFSNYYTLDYNFV